MISNAILKSRVSVHIYIYLKLGHDLIEFYSSILGTKHNMDF